jgi:flagellar hook assembly protein FlgD
VPSEVKLEIFDLLGRRVRVLVDTKQNDGFHNTLWDGKTAAGRSVATGVYFYRIKTKRFVKTRKRLLVR